jgi:hypothetical protein
MSNTAFSSRWRVISCPITPRLSSVAVVRCRVVANDLCSSTSARVRSVWNAICIAIDRFNAAVLIVTSRAWAAWRDTS